MDGMTYNGSWTWQDDAWRAYDSTNSVTATSNSNATITWRTQTGPDDDEGSAGVREPRRPIPRAPAGVVGFVFA